MVLRLRKIGKKKKKGKEAGFTLIETIVALAVFSITTAALFYGIYALFKNYKYSFQQSQAVEEARRGIETMVREVRQAIPGDNGSYPIEKAGDSELIFYSDINGDGRVERVRYFLGSTETKTQTKECVSYTKGGGCTVVFSNFFNGNLKSAKVKISVEGDLGWTKEYIDIAVDGQTLGGVCNDGCSDCPGVWQGSVTYDVTDLAADNSIQFTASETNRVDPICDWRYENHSAMVKFELSWTEEIPDSENKLKKGVIEPTTSSPVEYPEGREKIYILSNYVRNEAIPIFEYYDSSGSRIEDYPARLSDTKLIKVYLKINVDQFHVPAAFELESYVQPRNLKESY